MKNAALRTLTLASLSAILVAAPDHAGHSSRFGFTVRLDASRVSTSDGLVSVSPRTGENYLPLADEGRPALPYRIVEVVLPAGTAYESFGVRTASRTVVSRQTPPAIAPRDGFMQDDGSLLPAPAGDPVAKYVEGQPFPADPVRYLGTGQWHGRSIASFAVFPVQDDNGDVTVTQEMTVTITTRMTSRSDLVRPRRASPRVAAMIDASMRARVINPEMLSSYVPIERVVPRPGTGFKPTAAPSLEGSPVENVIITVDDLATSFQRLADWKTARGVPTVVRTLSWIRANYRNGVDDAETIRYFIRDAYENWGIRWVTIGGDMEEIPARYALSDFYHPGTMVPTDFYFQCLDGTWNDDHDAIWGENPVDNLDLYAEILIGRLPASTSSEVDILIDKIETYEYAVDRDYNDKMLMLAEVLFPSPWSQGESIDIDGATLADFLYNKHLAATQLSVAKVYENYTAYPGSVPESRAIAIDSLNSGFGHVYHIGHGFRFNMHCADDNVTIPDADALFNDNRFSNVLMLNCTAAAFDYDCLAEHLLLNPGGGAITTFGASNSALALVSLYYMDHYTDALFAQRRVHIGDAFSYSREPRTAIAALGDNADYWTHIIQVLLADPELPVFIGPVDTMSVAHIDTIPAGAASIQVDVVDSGGMPTDSATVCLWKDLEDYQTMTTGPSGSVTFDFHTATPGSISVVVSAENMRRHQSWIYVTPGSGPVLSVASVTVDDDSTGGSYGNNDGVIDAGETVDITVNLVNTGDADAADLTLLLSTLSSNVTVIDSAASVPLAQANGIPVAAADTWRISVGTGTPDEAIAEFDVAIVDTGAGTWDASFAKVLHRPKLELRTIRFDDSMPIGNGDGVLSNGESFLLFCEYKNYGTGTSYGLSAQLTSVDGGAVVTTASDSYADLGRLDVGENMAGFELSETSVAIENLLEITVTDLYGRTVTDTVELRPPAPPSNFSFDASLGIDKLHVTWDPSVTPDVNRYYLYYSTTQGGPYTVATADPVLHTTVTASGLLPNTRYYFVATAIDSSGNQSAQSTEATASTNPPQLTGWPNVVPDGSANSPAIGDVDGDGKLDVVVGNDKMYVWRHDGTEVIDGDGLSQTHGVLSDQGQDFIGPAALAKIDGEIGLEVIAAAYTSQEVYIFNKSGQVLSGWPQPTLDQVRATVVVGDIDGDDDVEILAIDQNATLYAWHHDGTEVRDGDNNGGTNGVFYQFPDTPWWQYQAPSLADLDNDGALDIIVCTQDSMLYVMDDSANALPGWPRQLADFAGGGVAIGDIDDDGDLEIVVPSKSSEVLALHHDNTVLWVRYMPQNTFFNPSPALGDLTGDGKLETVLPASTGKLNVVRYDGSNLPGFPVTYSATTYTESSPIIADINGDGSPDIILGDETKSINGWDASGNPLDGFPLVTGDAMRGTPAVADLDRDGDVEVIAVGYDRTVYVWEFSAPFVEADAPWPMFKADEHRTGRHGAVISTHVPEDAADIMVTRLGRNFPNPFNPTTTIAFDLAIASPHVSLVIYDVTGARVRTLHDGPLGAGHHTRLWDGRNDRGGRVSSGVYFLRFVEHQRNLVFARKMVLLK